MLIQIADKQLDRIERMLLHPEGSFWFEKPTYYSKTKGDNAYGIIPVWIRGAGNELPIDALGYDFVIETSRAWLWKVCPGKDLSDWAFGFNQLEDGSIRVGAYARAEEKLKFRDCFNISMIYITIPKTMAGVPFKIIPLNLIDGLMGFLHGPEIVIFE